MDLSQTPGTLDDDEVAVPCRRSWLQTRSVSGDGGGQRYQEADAEGREARINSRAVKSRNALPCARAITLLTWNTLGCDYTVTTITDCFRQDMYMPFTYSLLSVFLTYVTKLRNGLYSVKVLI
jgi:hypothetical protein